jgi:hypothetical protein
MYVTLPEIKEHLIIEHDLDDEYLILLEAAASDAAAGWINRKLCEVVEEEGKLPDSIHARLSAVFRQSAHHEPFAECSGRGQRLFFMLL